MAVAIMVALLLQVAASPASLQLFHPAKAYDAGIPTLRQAIGHDFGEEITSPEQITLYLKALAAAAPDRTRLLEYARTWEGRPLHALVLGHPGRIAELGRIQEDLVRFADPRKLSSAEAERLVRELPVVTWLLHAVHGNETSSPDAALAQAYYLLAARDDTAVGAILKESIVLIDPLQNPDGRARFVFQERMGRSAAPDPEPASAEHDEPWPGGRSNHYLFDMNRDWFAQTQPETRGRTRLYLQWQPHVVADLHEMGGNSTYYFAPPADPLNPHITSQQAGFFDLFGRENARRFDELGFEYFKGEIFDSFYPGYGESWPIFHGAIGMTYEQASARGLVYRREDDSLLTFRAGIVRHFTAAITTAETAARNRERILREFLEYRRSAVKEGEQGKIREYLMPPGPDPARSSRLARLLAAQGIEVLAAEESFKVGSRELPAGTYILPLAQPAGRMLRNLVDPHTPQPEEFVKRQDRLRKRHLPDEIYDVTAWSLPETFDVEIVTAERPSGVRSAPIPLEVTPESKALRPAKVGYLLPWGSGTAGAVVEALQSGIQVRSADLPFTLSGRKYPGGTAYVRAAEQGEDLAARLAVLAARHDTRIVPIDTAYVDDGISLGSNRVVRLKAPRVLLAWDEPTSTLSAGWARYTLERRFGQPVTAVRAGSLRRVDMRRYDVLVLPAGSYSDTFSGDALRRLKDWISAGGTLITLGEASRWAARKSLDLFATQTLLRDGRPETEPSEKDQEKKSEAPAQPFELEKALQPEREPPLSTPGALLRVELDTEHWLTAGLDGEIQVMVEGRRVFAPLKLDKGRNVGMYARKDRLVVGGLVWEEAQELLAQKPFLMEQRLGRGHIIAFAEDPNFRAFTEAAQLLFMNAVLLGPAH